MRAREFGFTHFEISKLLESKVDYFEPTRRKMSTSGNRFCILRLIPERSTPDITAHPSLRTFHAHENVGTFVFSENRRFKDCITRRHLYSPNLFIQHALLEKFKNVPGNFRAANVPNFYQKCYWNLSVISLKNSEILLVKSTNFP